ncbi:MAG: CoA-binding protein [Planctomycetota bacterium]|nr:CoA-binding protein [Planctomycetota bacterium]MDA1212143.1 CoA-binding protein [Planctomycetota bacterium]
MPTVAIIGASSRRHKFGNISLRAHEQQGYDVFAVNPNEETVEGHPAYASIIDIPVDHLDRVTMYVAPHIGITLLEEIASKSPKEVWFNPGSADAATIKKANELGLNVIQGCSIVDLGVSPGDF